MSLTVANQYAKALLSLSGKPGSTLPPEQALKQLDAIQALIQGSPELREALLSPAISADQKKKAIVRLGGMVGLHPLMSNFLNVVTGRRRVALLGRIRNAFQAHLDEQIGIERAEVTAARALSHEQQTALEAKLAGMITKKLRCAFAVDDALLGGVTVRIGSKMLDGSVRGRLETLRRRLVAEA